MAVARVVTVTFEDGRVGRRIGVAPLSVRVTDRKSMTDCIHEAIASYTFPMLNGHTPVVEFAMDTHTGHGVGFVRTSPAPGRFRTVAAFDMEAAR